jgi:hypothetical protein
VNLPPAAGDGLVGRLGTDPQHGGEGAPGVAEAFHPERGDPGAGPGGGPVLHRASALGDNIAAPQDPLVPLGGRPPRLQRGGNPDTRQGTPASGR